jgi:hypothetical protein
VRILDVKWLNKNLAKFYKFMGNTEDSSLFDNELIKILLMQQDYNYEIFRKFFMPALVYMASILLYYSLYLPNTLEPTGLLDRTKVGQSIIQIIIILYSGVYIPV